MVGEKSQKGASGVVILKEKVFNLHIPVLSPALYDTAVMIRGGL